MYAEQRRSSDNMSARSSDSDMSDVSALSRASSASRLSSTSYMSIQSERPGGRLRSALIRSHVQFKFYGCSYFIYSHPFPSSQSTFLAIILNVLNVFFSMHGNHCVSLCFISACQLLHASVPLHALSPLSLPTHKRTAAYNEWGKSKRTELRSKSLEEEKKDRRISWGVNGEEDRRRSAGKRRFSEELKRRRHTVAGDTGESR